MAYFNFQDITEYSPSLAMSIAIIFSHIQAAPATVWIL